MQDKTPLNDKDQQHGLWEEYYYNGKLCYKGEYLNGKRHGLFERYWNNGNLMLKGSYIKGELIGLWIHGNNDGSSINEIRFYT